MTKCPTCGRDVTEKASTLFVCSCKTIFTVTPTGRGYKGKQPMEIEIWGKAENYLDMSKIKISGAKSLVPKTRKVIE